jgi:predicted nucleic acid-binding protein
MDMETTVPIADTGFVVALLNQRDNRHQDVTPIYLQFPQILLPQTVLAEVAYLLGRDAGILTVAAFLKGLPKSRFQLTALNEQDIEYTVEILEGYADSRIDFVDATVMAIAERYQSSLILTLDQRDFRLFRPKHCASFELLP